MCSKEILDPKVIAAEVAACEEKIKEFEAQASNDADPEEQRSTFTGKVFVVLNKPKDCLKVLKSQDGYLLRLFKNLCGCCLDESAFWRFDRAPEPSDIFWENLNVGTCEFVLRFICSIFFTFIIIVVCIAIISGIKYLQNEYQEEQREKAEKKGAEAPDFTEQTMAKLISGGASVVVVVINVFLQRVMRAFSLFEQHDTQTYMHVSVAIKLTICRFLNSTLVLVIVNNDPATWFNGGDLVYDATLLIGIMTFQTPLTQVSNIPGIVKWCKKRRQKNNPDCKLTQREANEL